MESPSPSMNSVISNLFPSYRINDLSYSTSELNNSLFIIILGLETVIFIISD